MHSNPSGKDSSSQIDSNLLHGRFNGDIRIGLEDVLMDSHPRISDDDIHMLEDGFRRGEKTQLVRVGGGITVQEADRGSQLGFQLPRQFLRYIAKDNLTARRWEAVSETFKKGLTSGRNGLFCLPWNCSTAERPIPVAPPVSTTTLSLSEPSSSGLN